MQNQHINYYVQNISSDIAKHYKKKELEFDYIPKKEFKKFDKENVSIIGSIKLKTTNRTDVDTVTILSNNRTFVYELINKNNASNDDNTKEHGTMGYLKVADNTYVALIKTNVFLILLLPLMVIGILLFAALSITSTSPSYNPPNTESSLEFEDGEDISSESPNTENFIQESITIPGYANLYVSSSKPTISLINPEGNTVYITYSIKESEITIYETNAIKPNQMVKVNLKQLLSVGTHKLTFVVNTFDIETQAACNGATQSVDILVKE